MAKKGARIGVIQRMLDVEESSATAASVKSEGKDENGHPSSPPIRNPARPLEAAFRRGNTEPTESIKVDPNRCRLWRFADRPENEAQHARSLAESFRREGQLQPAVVRLIEGDSEHDYEIIAGQVRWRAALMAGTQLAVVIRECNDTEAFRIMLAENDERRNLSDYAKARRFRKALDEGLYDSKSELANNFDLSLPALSYYLAFAELPEEIFANVEDKNVITARWGYELAQAYRRGTPVEVIESLICEIEDGSIKRSNLGEAISRHMEGLRHASNAAEEHENDKNQADTETQSDPAPDSAPKIGKTKYASRTGQHLFTLSKRSGRGPVLSFPSNVSKIISEDFLERVRKVVEDELANYAAQNSGSEDDT